jgi:hypothetical protein
MWQFKTPAEERYLQLHLLAERGGGGWLPGFCERESEYLLNSTNVVSKPANFSSVLTSVVYGYVMPTQGPRIEITFSICE